MAVPHDQSRKLAPLLWTLLILFVLRVTGQALVAFLDVSFLPPMQEWYSGLMPYEYLLPPQLAIVVLMTKICLDFSRGGGFFVVPRQFFAVYWLYFGYAYLAVMVARYPVQMYLRPEMRWFDRHDTDLLPLGARRVRDRRRQLSPQVARAVTITEPATLLTDYLRGGITGWLGARLWCARGPHTSRLLWALALMALAFAAALGGSYHGFVTALEDRTAQILWKATVLAIGTGAFCMIAGSAWATSSGRVRGALVGLALFQLAAYTAWMLAHDDYGYVVADTAVAMAAVTVLHARAAWAGEDAARWMLAAVAVAVVAAAVQVSGFALHRHFNHNDLYHVIQVGAMTLFYKGAGLLRDRPVPS